MASASTPSRRGDPSLLVRDGSSIGHAGSPFTFEVTNRGTEPVRVVAITVGGDDVTDDHEVRVDARRSVTTRTDDTDGTVTFRLAESTTVEPGDAATIRLFGVDPKRAGRGVVVTLHTERDGRSHETTAHLTG
jgi:hypothetical protein